ncbi:MAG TPA: transglycosylase SLT domain-containing protein [Bacteriovoracaceae bacterium]|nr:transglycosylase SLT domain-containing protein [Bacteriovoracaceae bacterium]
MEPTTGETSVPETLEVAAKVEAKKTIFSLLFSTYKIPLFSLVLFGAFTLRALNPDTFNLGFKRQKTYRFKSDKLGFFIGDANFFNNSSYDEAEEQMVKLFPPNVQKKVKKVIRPVLILCEKHQLDPFWVLSVMWTESSFQHTSKSNKGARGLMQLMPPTYVETINAMKKRGVFLESDRGEDYLRYQYGQVYYDLGYSQLVSKLRNLEVGIYYLKGLLEDFNYNHYHATISYNMGPNWTKSQLRNNLPVGQRNNYLNKVLKNYYHITRTLSQNTNVSFIPRI